ncbi:hypothetical protein U9K47_16445 [Bacillus toyonensis]|nr:hypothetical protein [Bacillus toyonensis]MCU5302959.1 hypothetical protein [Bacillus toyonensis]HDR7406384.1 hypothetical protein [Bacillus toyonensis]
MRDNNIECESLLDRLDFVLLRIQQVLQTEFIQSATIQETVSVTFKTSE